VGGVGGGVGAVGPGIVGHTEDTLLTRHTPRKDKILSKILISTIAWPERVVHGQDEAEE
jgi:hypothetical protein